MFSILEPLDAIVSHFFSSIHTPFFDLTMPWLTDIFGPGVLAVVFIVIFFFSKKRKQFEVFWAFIVATLGSFLANNILSHIVARPRPPYGLVDEGASYSFPSNHSVLAFSMYSFLIFLVCRSTLPKRNKIVFSVTLSLLIIFVGASRLYLGVHYASDIIGGYLIGLIFVLISTKVVRTIEDDTV